MIGQSNIRLPSSTSSVGNKQSVKYYVCEQYVQRLNEIRMETVYVSLSQNINDTNKNIDQTRQKEEQSLLRFALRMCRKHGIVRDRVTLLTPSDFLQVLQLCQAKVHKRVRLKGVGLLLLLLLMCVCVHNLCNDSTSISNTHFCLILILINFMSTWAMSWHKCPRGKQKQKTHNSKFLSPFLSLSLSLCESLSL